MDKLTEENRKKIMTWWDSKPVNTRIELKNHYMSECKYLVNVKAENLINSGCYNQIVRQNDR